MILQNRQNTERILMKTTYMTWEFVVIFLMVDLSGSKMLVILMQIQSVKIFQ